MQKILYLTFYFEPDLCAGSFRNTPLAKELAKQAAGRAEIEVITTAPNRYSTFNVKAPAYEEYDNMKVHRIDIPLHKSGFTDQIHSFRAYFNGVKELVKGKRYDMVFASSSRLFTAYLGYTIAKRLKVPLYLDIRDIFTDTMQDVLKNPALRTGVLPVLRTIERRTFNYAKHINLISGGFRPYFAQYTRPAYSAFPNGIDGEFLNLKPSTPSSNSHKVITYAGNIGEGQGLHKIVPQAAKELGEHYRFLVIGDGGAKHKLEEEISKHQVSNVEIRKPVSRKELLEIYNESDFLFIHLNDYDAFKKVLPSKVFELGAYDKPIIAGVAGFANAFIEENIPNKILFAPGDYKEMVRQLNGYQYHVAFRKTFLEKFRRENINREMAGSILSYLPA
jgi:hypothetical protein